VKVLVPSESGIEFKKIKEYEKEVDQALEKLQIRKSTLKTVTLELPFHPPTVSPVA
jgi:hypothetical protein